MKNPLLNATIMRILSRLDPVPVQTDTLAAEIDISLAEPVTTVQFRAALADLRRMRLVAVGEIQMLGVETVRLTDAGRREAAKL